MLISENDSKKRCTDLLRQESDSIASFVTPNKIVAAIFVALGIDPALPTWKKLSASLPTIISNTRKVLEDIKASQVEIVCHDVVFPFARPVLCFNCPSIINSLHRIY